MSLIQAQARISDKALTEAGQKLGQPLGPVSEAGSGGFVREFQRGAIYWHRNTSAQIVRGNIAVGYSARGGPGSDPAFGARRFGYPRTDELRTPDEVPYQRFEFGLIIATPGLGSVAVVTAHLTAEGDPTRRTSLLGLPISDTTRAGALIFTRFERGMIFNHNAVSRPITMRLHCGALLGRPAIVSSARGTRLPFTFEVRMPEQDFVVLEAALGPGQTAEQLLAPWRDALLLRAVGTQTVHAVAVGGLVNTSDNAGGRPTRILRWRATTIADETRRLGALHSLSMVARNVPVAERRLYDLAPHSVYAGGSFTSFGAVHATDIHVAARYDTYRAIWRRHGHLEALKHYSNPNDNFRNFIRWANIEHDAGRLDMVIATGDLVEYIFEDWMNKEGAGNFKFFANLVRGIAHSPDVDGAASEPLRVPMFVTYGNHDYRPNAFPLFFEFRIDDVQPLIEIAKLIIFGPVSLFFKSPDITVVRREYRSFNLLEEDALVIQNRKRLKLSQKQAENLAEFVQELPVYAAQHIAPRSSYSVEIGDHLLLMGDTGPDVGVIETIVDWALGKTGIDDNAEAFLGGTPNSRGLDIDPNSTRGLIEAQRGLVIFGMHAPPFNTEGSEMAWYFRASARRAAESAQLRNLVNQFIRRHREFQLSVDDVHREWPREKTAHFCSGPLSELAASGSAKNNEDTWVDVFLGRPGRRGVDLVLCGHVHRDHEVSLQRLGNGDPAFVADFHTENRAASYKTIEFDTDEKVHVVVVDPAQGEIRRRTRDEVHEGRRVTFTEVQVPGNADTLQATADKAEWWRRHAPLIIQSPCLGPTDSNQRRAGKQNPLFQGVRMITVREGVIRDISLVTLAEIERILAKAAKQPGPLKPGGEIAQPPPQKPKKPKPGQQPPINPGGVFQG